MIGQTNKQNYNFIRINYRFTCGRSVYGFYQRHIYSPCTAGYSHVSRTLINIGSSPRVLKYKILNKEILIFLPSIYKFGLSVCLSVCLFVCLYPINVKTAEPIGPKFFVGHHVIPGKVYGWSNFQKFASIKIRFLKILNIHEIFFENPRNFLFLLFVNKWNKI